MVLAWQLPDTKPSQPQLLPSQGRLARPRPAARCARSCGCTSLTSTPTRTQRCSSSRVVVQRQQQRRRLQEGLRHQVGNVLLMPILYMCPAAGLVGKFGDRPIYPAALAVRWPGRGCVSRTVPSGLFCVYNKRHVPALCCRATFLGAAYPGPPSGCWGASCR